MTLTEEQKQAVAQWAAAGAGLSEIQSRLTVEFGVRLSYMETRFLILDLGAQIKDKEQPEPPSGERGRSPSIPPAQSYDEADDGEIPDDDDNDGGRTSPSSDQSPSAPPASAVSVDINPITRPGFALTGTVVFSDGVKAEWGITNDGRFALEAATPGYKPSAGDIREFQLQLRAQMARKGY